MTRQECNLISLSYAMKYSLRHEVFFVLPVKKYSFIHRKNVLWHKMLFLLLSQDINFLSQEMNFLSQEILFISQEKILL